MGLILEVAHKFQLETADWNLEGDSCTLTSIFGVTDTLQACQMMPNYYRAKDNNIFVCSNNGLAKIQTKVHG